MNLPESFLTKMESLLQHEYDDFVKSYQDEKSLGFRINSLKVPIDDFLQKSPFTTEKIPWVTEGFFYPSNDRPGKHPYHDAGLYYIQEPSAMAAGEIVDPKPDDKVLDLCAAPGGKTTHLASKMDQQGFLLSNEIHPARAKILSQNVERMGIKNAVVTNETPERLAERFPSFFDRILVDAPCSGEGMFRKDEDAREHWSQESVELCHVRQLDILKYAAAMLKPEGRLVYSTCTFSPEENEGTISRFLEQHPNFEIEEVPIYKGFSQGRKEWGTNPADNLEKTIRLWPHLMKGEGHYIAVLKKKDGDSTPLLKLGQPKVDANMLKHYKEFAKESLNFVPTGKFVTFNDQLYLLPDDALSLDKLKVVRPGWHLGTFKKNRFEPSHALALSLKGDEVKNRWNLSLDSKEIISYLKGETLQATGDKGWYLVEVDGHSIGWGKLAGNCLKNHYPKGLRWMGNIY